MMLCFCGKTALFIRGSGKKAGRCRDHKDVLDYDEAVTGKKVITRGRRKKARPAADTSAETT
jgi:hypothetical protein